MNRRTFLSAISVACCYTLVNVRNVFAPIPVFSDNNNNNDAIYELKIPGLEKFEILMETAQKEYWHLLPIGTLISRIGLYFLNTPYISYTLEHHPENVVINFEGMDCFTFVESTINIARQIKAEQYTIGHIYNNIKQTRYRDGEIVDYASRLHYFSE